MIKFIIDQLHKCEFMRIVGYRGKTLVYVEVLQGQAIGAVFTN